MTRSDFEAIEVFAIIGAPARLYGRLPLITRYLWNGQSGNLLDSGYAKARFGPSYRWRAWLQFDMAELEVVEDLLNTASDERVMEFRKNQLGAFQMVSIVGALVSGIATAALVLPEIEKISYVSRALFLVAVIMALLATFFTCLQQRTYGFLEEPATIRAWLSNGQRYNNRDGREVFKSSLVSHELLSAPFELLCIAITSFLGGIGVYLGSATSHHLQLGSESESVGNIATLVVVVVTTIFALSMLGQLLGGKDAEWSRFSRLITEQYAADVGRRKEGQATGTAPNKAMERPLSPAFGPGLARVMEASFEQEDRRASSLVEALTEAAKAHRACAAADAEVARCYAQLN